MSPLALGTVLSIVIIVISNKSCYASSVDITISPEMVSISDGSLYLDAVVNITCKATADRDTIQSLIPFNIINGTYIQYSCVGSPEYNQITQRFSVLPYYYKNISNQAIFTTMISLSPISPLDNGLQVACCFYNPETEQHEISETRTINVTIVYTQTSTQTTVPNELSNSTPSIFTTIPNNTSTVVTHSGFVKSEEFYITIGAFSTITFILVILIIVLIIVVISQKRKIQFVVDPNAPPPVPAPAEVEVKVIRFTEV